MTHKTPTKHTTARRAMIEAWSAARQGQAIFGGSIRSYLAEALRQAWADHGQSIFWNRRISSVEIRPVPAAADSFFDVIATIDLAANYEGELGLPTDLQLLINGEPVPTPPTCPGGCGDTLVWNPCFEGGCPAPCAFDGAGGFLGECSGSCSPTLNPCNCCVSGYIMAIFPAIALEPGSSRCRERGE